MGNDGKNHRSRRSANASKRSEPARQDHQKSAGTSASHAHEHGNRWPAQFKHGPDGRLLLYSLIRCFTCATSNGSSAGSQSLGMINSFRGMDGLFFTEACILPRLPTQRKPKTKPTRHSNRDKKRNDSLHCKTQHHAPYQNPDAIDKKSE